MNFGIVGFFISITFESFEKIKKKPFQVNYKILKVFYGEDFFLNIFWILFCAHKSSAIDTKSNPSNVLEKSFYKIDSFLMLPHFTSTTVDGITKHTVFYINGTLPDNVTIYSRINTFWFADQCSLFCFYWGFKFLT